MHDLSLIAPLMVVILLGILCAYFGFFSTSDTSTIVKLVFYLIIPVLIFTSLANFDIHDVFYWPYIFSYFLASIFVMIFIGIISRYWFKRDHKEIILNVMGGTHTNSVYLALPLFLLLFKNTAPVISIIILQAFITLVIVTALELSNIKKPKKGLQLFYDVLVKNPLIIAATFGFLVSCFQIKIPFFLNHTLKFIAAPGDFLALFALGLALFLDNKPISKKDSSDVALIILAKNFFHPLTAFLLGKYIFHLNHYWLFSLVIMCMMPSAKNLFIFAKKYNVNCYKYNWIVAGTTMISLILIALVMAFFN